MSPLFLVEEACWTIITVLQFCPSLLSCFLCLHHFHPEDGNNNLKNSMLFSALPRLTFLQPPLPSFPWDFASAGEPIWMRVARHRWLTSCEMSACVCLQLQNTWVVCGWYSVKACCCWWHHQVKGTSRAERQSHGSARTSEIGNAAAVAFDLVTKRDRS